MCETVRHKCDTPRAESPGRREDGARPGSAYVHSSAQTGAAGDGVVDGMDAAGRGEGVRSASPVAKAALRAAEDGLQYRGSVGRA
jgi:hypothetical protein